MSTIHNGSILKQLLSELATKFSIVSELLSVQIQSVVRHDLPLLTEAIEKQIILNNDINQLEKSLKEELIASFSRMDITPEAYTLNHLLPYLEKERGVFADIRQDLRTSVEETHQKQEHLTQLLRFAQNHLNETLKSVFQLADQHSIVYQSSGKKVARGQSRMINQTM